MEKVTSAIGKSYSVKRVQMSCKSVDMQQSYRRKSTVPRAHGLPINRRPPKITTLSPLR